MDRPVFLADVIEVRSRFQRSVHLERDYNTCADGYHPTESALQALRAVDRALGYPTDRAMTLIGPYGAGKSAFCVQLAHLLEHRTFQPWLQAAGSLNGSLARLFQSDDRALIPILLVGSRQSLASSLTAALTQGLQRRSHVRLLEHLKRESEALRCPAPSPRQTADLYHMAASHAVLEGAYGVVLIVDEMGKFLEHAALHPQEGDIFVLQELAEAAARSGEHPLIVMTVLHQSAEAYAQKLGRTFQAEWSKIGERFRQIAFFPSDMERIEMVGLALKQNNDLHRDAIVERLSLLCVERKLTPPGLEERFPALACAAYPLHPVSLLTLPALFRKIGQSHRSLFAFLSGDEPHALGRFLRETPYVSDSPPLYMPDSVFDYAAEALRGSWNAPGAARLWAEAVDTVDRAFDLPELPRRVLKVIALLGILKDPRLTPSQSTLECALTTGSGEYPDISDALLELQERRLIVYSRTYNTYRLWEGGDVDIEAEMAAARAALPAGISLHVASNLCPPPKLIARRHSYETGTVRAVTSVPCGVMDLKKTAAEHSSQLTVLLCLVTSQEEVEQAETTARSCDQSQTLIAIARETDTLREAAQEIAAAQRVAQETPGLASDRAARRELATRRQEAETAFRQEWNRLFMPDQKARSETSWFYQRQRIEIVGTRKFSAHLSRMADLTFPDAPRLRNELINRQTLSSAAAAGRRELIEAMLTHSAEQRLGIRGFPPSASMYECLLRATGIHQEVAPGRWGFASPSRAPLSDPARLLPCWQALERMIFREPPEPRPLREVYAALSAPPYGITAGVMPVLLCAFLLAHPDETTLYREDTFIAEPTTADWEVLLRRPELFAVAGCRVSGDRAAVVQRLARGLKCAPALVPVVRALLRMVRSLPEHSWKTRRLPEHVLALRDAMQRARSPESLLFRDLPAALGIIVLSGQEVDDAHVEEFFRALNAALQQWSRATPDVVAQARDALLLACGLNPGSAGFHTLREQAAVMEPQVMDPRLLPLVRRAAQPGDDQTVLESVLALVADRPPRTWTDADADRFHAQTKAIGAVFRREWMRAEELASSSLSPDEETHSRQLLESLRQYLRTQPAYAQMPPRVLRAALSALLQEVDRNEMNEGVQTE